MGIFKKLNELVLIVGLNVDVREKVSSPRGLPIAITSSPTLSSSESPRTTGVRFSASTK